MKLKDVKPSKNFVDKTSPDAMNFKDKMGSWLLKNGYINDVNGKPYTAPWQAPTKSAPGDWPTNGADIPGVGKAPPNPAPPKNDDWLYQGSDLNFAKGKPQGLMGPSSKRVQPSSKDNDRFARSRGFKNADMMIAFDNQRQKNMKGGGPSSTSSGGSWGSLIDRAMPLHPKVLLEGVLRKMNKALP